MSLSPEDHVPAPSEMKKKLPTWAILLIVAVVVLLSVVCCLILLSFLVPTILYLSTPGL